MLKGRRKFLDGSDRKRVASLPIRRQWLETIYQIVADVVNAAKVDEADREGWQLDAQPVSLRPQEELVNVQDRARSPKSGHSIMHRRAVPAILPQNAFGTTFLSSLPSRQITNVVISEKRV